MHTHTHFANLIFVNANTFYANVSEQGQQEGKQQSEKSVNKGRKK